MKSLKRISLASLRMKYGFFFIRMGSFAAGRLEETDVNFHYFVLYKGNISDFSGAVAELREGNKMKSVLV